MEKPVNQTDHVENAQQIVKTLGTIAAQIDAGVEPNSGNVALIMASASILESLIGLFRRPQVMKAMAAAMDNPTSK